MSAPSAAEGRPYVSIVLTGRNDGYGGDFLRRFLATLRFNSRELSARRIAHEFVLVEWAPMPGSTLLADIVDAEVAPPIAATVRSVIVDAAYHDAVTLNPRLAYQEFLAKNVGVRRARGEYVITSNADVFLGREILARLAARELEPAVVYRAARFDVKSTDDLEQVDWKYLEDPTSLARPVRKLQPPYFGGGAGDFIALDRDSFERIRGFNEVYRLVRIGIDGNFLVHARSSGVAIVDIGGPVYHVDHAGSYRAARPDYAGREGEAPYGDERWPADAVVYRNQPTWGLARAPEHRVGPRRLYLDFSWDAVPPLVDLAGVVLPSQHQPVATLL
jgi:hypothetical protein